MPTLLTEIESKLAASGYISGLIRAYQLSGTINPFIVIAGGSGREYGSDLDLRDAVLSVLDGVMKGIGSNINYAATDSQTGLIIGGIGLLGLVLLLKRI